MPHFNEKYQSLKEEIAKRAPDLDIVYIGIHGGRLRLRLSDSRKYITFLTDTEEEMKDRLKGIQWIKNVNTPVTIKLKNGR